MFEQTAAHCKYFLAILALKTVMFFTVNLQFILRIEYFFAILTRDNVIGLGVL